MLTSKLRMKVGGKGMVSIKDKIKIMLMDQDDALVRDIAGMLETAGYTVISTGDKNSAMEMGIQQRPNLGIFEASEGESCCLDTAIELYNIYDIPFIVISECKEAEKINKAVLSGALSYLLKPIHSEQLLPVIESALQRASDIRKLQDTEQNLSTAIDTSRVISAAIGIMMERFRLTNKMAFELLRSEARSSQKKVIEIANEILKAAETVNQFNLRK